MPGGIFFALRVWWLRKLEKFADLKSAPPGIQPAAHRPGKMD